MKALPRIPGYELLTCLGGGVITTVYEARRCEDDFPCAVKLLRPDWEDQPVATKLLQRKARAGWPSSIRIWSTFSTPTC